MFLQTSNRSEEMEVKVVQDNVLAASTQIKRSMRMGQGKGEGTRRWEELARGTRLLLYGAPVIFSCYDGAVEGRRGRRTNERMG